jgi:CDGSH-type Zn-finger protein
MAEEEKNKAITVVTVIESGPLRIKGNIILKDLQRNTETVPGEVWLCRCGKSSNKPFCDGSHKIK